MNSRAYAVIFMFVITFFFTSLVTMVKVMSEERIRINQQVKLQKVVLKALHIPMKSASSIDEIVRLFKTRIKQNVVQGRKVYTAFDPSGGKPLSYATSISGSGFWGPVHVMVAVDSNVSHIIGIEFYRHQETPGLGARITEPWFKKQFEGLALTFDTGQKKFFTFTPFNQDKKVRQLDAITGATQTSRAVEGFLNRELQFFKVLQEQVENP